MEVPTFIAFILCFSICHGSPVQFHEEKGNSRPQFSCEIINDPGDTDTFRNAWRNESWLWVNKTVPYMLSMTMLPIAYSRMMQAMNRVEKDTCIKFVERRPTDEIWINIFNDNRKDKDGKWKACTSWRGRRRAGQSLKFGWGCAMATYLAIHELMHALGFAHEPTRYDRDKYITIHWENIIEKQIQNVMVEGPETAQLCSPFDFASVLMTGPGANAKPGTRSWSPNPGYEEVDYITDMSKYDILKINNLYKCNKDSACNY